VAPRSRSRNIRRNLPAPLLFAIAAFGILAALASVRLPSPFAALLWVLLSALFLLRLRSAGSRPAEEGTPPRSPSLAWLAAIVAGGAAVRFVLPGGLFPWPTGDESENLLIGWTWALEGWDRRFFHGFAQHPPAYHAMLASAFKAFGPSPAVMASVTATLSTLSVALTWAAVEPFAGRRVALYAATLSAFGAWPLLIARSDLVVGPAIPAFLLCLAALGAWRRADDPARRRGIACLAGLAAGAGFLAYGAWPLTALTLLAAAFALSRARPGRAHDLLAMAAASLPGAALFVWAALREGFGSHIRDRAILSEPGVLPTLMGNAWANGQTFLAGRGTLVAEYAPIAGGLFDPVSAALLLEGIALLLRRRFLSPALAVCVLLLALPGLVTRGVEPFRVLPLFLVALPVAALGLDSVSRAAGPRRGIVAWILLAAISVAGTAHLFGPYRSAVRSWDPRLAHMRSAPDAEAFRILRKQSDLAGPGWVMESLRARPADPALQVRSYPFDRPCRPPGAARWAALVLDAHYRPFLERRWPDAALLPLRAPGDGSPRLLMCLHAAPAADLRELEEICAGNLLLATLGRRQLLRANGSSNREDLEAMTALAARFQDPLLVSVAAERVVTLAGAERRRLGEDPGDRLYRGSLAVLEDALRRGYPAEHLRYIHARYLSQKGMWRAP
jgi:hypothetical protein